LKPGEEIRVHLKNGTEIEGEFEGMSQIPEEKYQSLYDDFTLEIPFALSLPQYGDSISIYLSHGQVIERRFLGFDYQLGDAEVQHETELPCYISVGFINNSISGKVYLSEIDSIMDSRGNRMRAEHMNLLASNYDLPVRSEIQIDGISIEKPIPLSEIDHVSRKNRRTAKYALLGIGAAIDISFITLAVIALLELKDANLGLGN
jgi:hypothetical protein